MSHVFSIPYRGTTTNISVLYSIGLYRLLIVYLPRVLLMKLVLCFGVFSRKAARVLKSCEKWMNLSDVNCVLILKKYSLDLVG